MTKAARTSDAREKAARSASVDPEDVARFDALGEEWWDLWGPMRALHKLNPTRVDYVREILVEELKSGAFAAAATRPSGAPADDAPLSGLSLLDIGCGGGILSEPLARLGARVTGIDPVASFPYDGSAIAYWDSGPLRPGLAPDSTIGTDPPPLTNTAPAAGEDPHELPRVSDTAVEMIDSFLREGGAVTNPCAPGPCLAGGNWPDLPCVIPDCSHRCRKILARLRSAYSCHPASPHWDAYPDCRSAPFRPASASRWRCRSRPCR